LRKSPRSAARFSRYPESSTMPWYTADMRMARPLPRTPVEWLEEIRDAMLDACDTKPFGILTGHPITDADLFHLAPLVCLKFRGRKTKGPEAKRVTERDGLGELRGELGAARSEVSAHAGVRPVLRRCPPRPRLVEREGCRGYPELLRRTLGRGMTWSSTKSGSNSAKPPRAL